MSASDPANWKARLAVAYRDLRAALSRFVRQRLAASPEDVEDLVQDVFYEALAHLDEESSAELGDLAAWLFHVARNKIVDRWRSKRRPAPDSLQRSGADGESLESLIADSGIDVEAAFLRESLLGEIAGAIAELPADQRDVFVAQTIEGRTFRELSELRGESINTLISRKKYAVDYLRRRLGEIDVS